MIQALNLTGTWTGTYAYADGDERPDVTFVVEIVDVKGAFKGTVQDGVGGHPMPGQIVGKVTGSDSVEFVKTMPAILLALPDGSSDLLEGRAQKIFYTGHADGPDTFRGQWTIRCGFKWVYGRLYLLPATHGTWRMSRSQ